VPGDAGDQLVGRHSRDVAQLDDGVEPGDPSRRAQTERLAEERAKLAQMEPPGTEIRREREIAARLLDARAAQALTAARIEPPSCIVKELGERPADPTSTRAWDHGVQEVERYRLEHGVRDKGSAFGREPQDALARATREAAQRRLAEIQRRLNLEQQLTRTRELTRSIG
jgi:hypothetical protein